MSLFIGNISKRVTNKQFQQAFRNYGRCKVDLRKKFAFVQYQNDKDAERAKGQLHNKDFCGLRLNIQWSKNSGRFQQNHSRGNKQYTKRRSVSRQRSWDRYKRYRSVSRERRRDSPDYSQDTDVPPMCPRDFILIRKLQQRKQRQRLKRQKEPQKMEIMKQQDI